MDLKEEILGVRCELAESQREILADEAAVAVGKKEVIVKKKGIGFFDNLEKFAVIGESPFFLKPDCISSLIGPSVSRNFLVKINSRGYLHEIIVPEESVIFLK